jgi:hypothetical protein
VSRLSTLPLFPCERVRCPLSRLPSLLLSLSPNLFTLRLSTELCCHLLPSLSLFLILFSLSRAFFISQGFRRGIWSGQYLAPRIHSVTYAFQNIPDHSAHRASLFFFITDHVSCISLLHILPTNCNLSPPSFTLLTSTPLPSYADSNTYDCTFPFQLICT